MRTACVHGAEAACPVGVRNTRRAARAHCVAKDTHATTDAARIQLVHGAAAPVQVEPLIRVAARPSAVQRASLGAAVPAGVAVAPVGVLLAQVALAAVAAVAHDAQLHPLVARSPNGLACGVKVEAGMVQTTRTSLQQQERMRTSSTTFSTLQTPSSPQGCALHTSSKHGVSMHPRTCAPAMSPVQSPMHTAERC